MLAHVQLYTMKNTDGGAAKHKVEYNGVLPPWTVDRLRACLQRSQDSIPMPESGEGGLLSMTCQALALSDNLNWEQHTGNGQPAGAPLSDLPGGWCDAEERRRWMGSRRDIGPGVVAKAVYDDPHHCNVTLEEPAGMHG